MHYAYPYFPDVPFFACPKKGTKEKAPRETAPSVFTAVLGKILKQANSLRSNMGLLLYGFSLRSSPVSRGQKPEQQKQDIIYYFVPRDLIFLGHPSGSIFNALATYLDENSLCLSMRTPWVGITNKYSNKLSFVQGSDRS